MPTRRLHRGDRRIVASPLLVLAFVASCSSSDGDTDPADTTVDADTSQGDVDTSDVDAGGDLPEVDAPDDTSDDTSDAPQTDVDADSDVETDTGAEITCIDPTTAGEPLPTPPIHTPRWAFEPWISKDISTGADTYSFVEGFRSRNIPVGVVVLDSPWETNYNTFVPNPSRYPDFAEMVANLREDGVRTVLWTTQMVNNVSFDFEIGGDDYPGPSPNFAEGIECGYFLNDGQTWPWWKGVGSAVDFFNPAARVWWHEQQNLVLDAGVAGWKLDFGEEYVAADTVQTWLGERTRQEYSEEYYRDFLAYGVQRAGADEFVTMVRPYDKSYQFEGRFYARPEHAPVAWVGDNRRDWIGFVDALDHLFRSSLAGYVVIGSDIGGYLDRDDQNIASPVAASDPAFYSWTGAAAFMPFFQLHGRANLEPWNYGADPELTTRIYRYWATLHHELVPFFYSLAEQAYASGGVIMAPVDVIEETWANDWRFTVGDAFLVAPILNDDWVRDVLLPEGADWYNWWTPGAEPLAGGTLLEDVAPGSQERIPVYVREGAIVPMELDSDVTGIGGVWADGTLALLVWPALVESSFTVLEEGEDGDVEVTIEAGCVDLLCSINVGPVGRDVLLRVPARAADIVAVNDVTRTLGRAATDVPDATWLVEEQGVAWIRLAASTETQIVSIDRSMR